MGITVNTILDIDGKFGLNTKTVSIFKLIFNFSIIEEDRR